MTRRAITSMFCENVFCSHGGKWIDLIIVMGISQIQGFNDLQIGRLKVGKIQNFQIGKFVHLGGLEISRLMDLKIQKCEEWDAPKFGGLKKIKRLEI